MQQRVCVIVGAYSTGKYLAPSFKAYGFDSIHIQHNQNIHPKFKKSFQEQDFIREFVYDEAEGVDKLFDSLNFFDLELIVPGCEPAVEIADQLCEFFCLPGNGTKWSAARRNKNLMIQKAQKHGLSTASTLCSSDLQTILDWAKDKNTLVLKPLRSAGGDNVHFCDTQDDIKKAFSAITDSKSVFYEVNKCVLAETFIQGIEYAINTVSWGGKTFVSEVWRVQKICNTPIYDYGMIITKDHPHYESIVNYTKNVLSALDIKYGAAYTELKYCPQRGPTLIECGARLLGGVNIAFVKKLLGYTQVSKLVEAYLNTNRFLQGIEFSNTGSKLYGLYISMISKVEGVINRDIDFSYFLRDFSTVDSFNVPLKKGHSIKRTIDLLTSPGCLYLVSDNESQIWEEYYKFREMEQEIYQAALRE